MNGSEPGDKLKKNKKQYGWRTDVSLDVIFGKEVRRNWCVLWERKRKGDALTNETKIDVPLNNQKKKNVPLKYPTYQVSLVK